MKYLFDALKSFPAPARGMITLLVLALGVCGSVIVKQYADNNALHDKIEATLENRLADEKACAQRYADQTDEHYKQTSEYIREMERLNDLLARMLGGSAAMVPPSHP